MDQLSGMARKQLRVLHVITRLVLGGAQQNTLLTVQHLDPSRYAVSLASGPSDGPEGTLEPQARTLGVPIFTLPSLVRDPHPPKDVATFAALLRIMRQGRYDIVHTHTTKAGILGRLAARVAGVPVIVHTPHGHAFQGYLRGTGSRALLLVERALARITDSIICLTDAEMKDHVDARVGRPEQYVVIHSGVDLDRINAARRRHRNGSRPAGIPSEGRLIGCVARLVPVKGITTLIRAMPQILEDVPDASLVLVGDGPQREFLHAEASRLRVLNRVVFLGLRHDVPELLPLFDVVVLPSLNEGMGKAAVEAMAAGRPLVASRTVGLQDVVADRRTGLLVAPGDAAALAGSVVMLIRNPAFAGQIGQAGSEAAQRYSITAMVDRISALYDLLYAGRSLLNLEDVHAV